MRDCLKEPNGQISSMRIMAFIALLAAIGVSATSLFLGTPINDNVVMWFLISAFGGKTGQKFAEKK